MSIERTSGGVAAGLTSTVCRYDVVCNRWRRVRGESGPGGLFGTHCKLWRAHVLAVGRAKRYHCTIATLRRRLRESARLC